MARATAVLTTGTMGSGKSYMRGAVFVAREWLPFHSGIHASNMPLNVEALEAYCAARYKEDCKVRDRVIRFSDDLVTQWMRDGTGDGKNWPLSKPVSGPWDLFGPGKKYPLSGTHLAFDEAHLLVPKAQDVPRRRAWRNWIREIRHSGGTVEFLTQNVDGVDKELRDMCDIRYVVINRASDKDPFLKIPMEDWYELKGKFLTGYWNPVICQHEKRRTDKGWEEIDTKRVPLCSEFYALYDSFSKPLSEQGEGEESSGHVEKRVFQKLSALGLLVWFFRRNFPSLVSALMVLAAFLWLTVGGGLPLLIGWLMNFIVTFSVGSSASASTEAAAGPGVEVLEEECDTCDEAKALAGVTESGERVAVQVSEIPMDTVLFQYGDEGYTLGDYRRLLEDRSFLETQVQVQEEELETWREESKTLTMLTPDYAVFSSGERVRVGEKIRRSGYDGLVLVAINFRERSCVLSDGQLLVVRVSDDETKTFGGLKLSGSGNSGTVATGASGGGGG